MNDTVDRVDAFQRRHPVIGFPLAVVYKYFDDQGPFLSAIIAFYGFIAIFPLLLIATSILGFVLQGDAALRDRLLDSALSQFPIVGDQLGRPEGLRGSTSAIVVGSIAALYGSLNLGQAAQNASNVVWAVPRNSRTNAVLQRLRSLVFLAVAGLGILALAITSSVLANPDAFEEVVEPNYGWIARVVGFVFTSVIFIGLFRLLSAGRGSTRSVLPGALAASVMWQALQVVGNAYVTRVVGTASQMNNTFALVLGLIAFLYAAGFLTVLSLEINVVLRRRLYPRALLTPFTDHVTPTEADLKAYTGYAKSQRHKGFQTIESTFDKQPGEPPR